MLQTIGGKGVLYSFLIKLIVIHHLPEFREQSGTRHDGQRGTGARADLSRRDQAMEAVRGATG